MKKIFIYLFIVIWFMGCVGSNRYSVNNLPNWYLNAPQNSNQKIYGVGVGENLKSAKSSAFDDMASRLSVNVNSKYQQTTKVDGGNYNKTIKQKINIEVKKIAFTNSKVEKTTISGGKTYILISVDKKRLFDQIYGDLQSLDSIIGHIEYSSQKYSSLERIQTLKAMIPDLKKATSQVKMLKVIDSNFDETSYLEKYNKIQLMMKELNQNLSFTLKENSQNKPYLDEIASSIANLGYKITSNSDLLIEVKIDGSHQKSKGWHIFKDRVAIFLKSNGKILSSQIVEAKGISVNEKKARINAIKKFGKKLDIKKLIFRE